MIIADDTKIEEIVSEEINTISRLIVVSKTFDDKAFKLNHTNIHCKRLPDANKIKGAIAYFSTSELAIEK